MKTGVVFDIREFAVHDGPGIRTTVFLKGCPLRCQWCHNPEGLTMEPVVIHGAAGDRVAGKIYTSEELATILNRQADVLRMNDGGVTFSGGEVLLQSDFVAEVIDQLDNIHVLIDTSGCGSEHAFRQLVSRSDLVFFDLKLIENNAHRFYTVRSNDLILHNLQVLSQMGKPFVIRVPLVPGVTDTDKNLQDIAETVEGLPGLVRVDLLPYNKAAGGKYESCGLEFKPSYDEKKKLNINLAPFSSREIEVQVA